ncbi:MAG: transcriptional repressor [Verrucomicrobia bacterium]|nr:transcriptional repressor [Verrucomicrobiota bacterium]
MSSARRHDHPHPSFRLDQILARLRSAGMRITKSRQQILITLLNAKRPLSLHEIQDGAAAGSEAPDFTTVFRVMNALEKIQLVQKVHLNRTSRYYELVNPEEHHDHIICTECGRVTLMVESCPVQEYQRTIERRYGYADLKHSLEFFGKCPRCK